MFAKLVGFLLDRFRTRSKKEAITLQAALRQVNDSVLDLVNRFDDLSPDQIVWHQAQLRAMYERASALTPVSTGVDHDLSADLLVNMISAVRMYVWLRTFDGHRTLDGMDHDQLRREIARPDITRSFTAAVRKILEKLVDGSEVTLFDVQVAKEHCLQTIGHARQAVLEILPPDPDFPF